MGRRVARKTLLAIAGLVSVHDHTWTTDRQSTAQRWSEIEPSWEPSLTELMAWSDSEHQPTAGAIAEALDGIVSHLIDTLSNMIGLWDSG